MKRQLGYFVSGVFLFFLFVIFSYLVQKNIFVQMDFDATVRLQDNVSRRFDTLFSWFSIVGSFQVLIVVLMGILLLFRKIIFGFVAFSLFGFFHVIELIGKARIEQEPPPQFLLRTEHPIDFPQFHVSTEFAYPSGHSGRTIFLSILLIFLILKSSSLPQAYKIFLACAIVLFNCIMLVSRVYLGEHWATDVVGGLLLASSFSLLSLTFLPSKRKTHHKSD